MLQAQQLFSNVVYGDLPLQTIEFHEFSASHNTKIVWSKFIDRTYRPPKYCNLTIWVMKHAEILIYIARVVYFKIVGLKMWFLTCFSDLDLEN